MTQFIFIGSVRIDFACVRRSSFFFIHRWNWTTGLHNSQCCSLTVLHRKNEMEVAPHHNFTCRNFCLYFSLFILSFLAAAHGEIRGKILIWFTQYGMMDRVAWLSKVCTVYRQSNRTEMKWIYSICECFWIFAFDFAFRNAVNSMPAHTHANKECKRWKKQKKNNYFN